MTAADGREVPVVEEPSSPSGEYFGSIGVLALAVSENADGTWSVAGSESEQIDTAGQYALADEGVEALADELAARNAEILDEVVGTSSTEYAYSTTELPGGWERIRTEDMPIGHVAPTSPSRTPAAFAGACRRATSPQATSSRSRPMGTRWQPMS